MGSGINHIRSESFVPAGRMPSSICWLQPLLPHRVPPLSYSPTWRERQLPRQVEGVVRRLGGEVGEEGLTVARLASMNPISLSV